MDIESAISRLKLLFSDASNEDYPYTELFGEAVNEGIQALEKQVAKKPKITSKVEDAEYMKCSGCGLTTVLYGGMRPDYCAKCGQKLDWSD